MKIRSTEHVLRHVYGGESETKLGQAGGSGLVFGVVLVLERGLDKWLLDVLCIDGAGHHVLEL